MSIQSGAPPYYYIAFIDESGDPGLERVRPVDNPGSSEWLVMGAAVIEVSNELAPVQWVRSISDTIGFRQKRELHYRDLLDWQKPLACQELAKLPVKLFALLSNKKNMRQHKNERAAAKSSSISPRQYFYKFCLRLILERITHYVLSHSTRAYGGPRHVKVIFSRRDGHGYGHTFAYNEILKAQARAGTTYLNKRTIRWEVMDYRLLETESHNSNAGLQLADIVASSFYQAVDILPPTLWDTRNAQLLEPSMAKYQNNFENYGVTFAPFNYYEADLQPSQIDIFEFYGFDRIDFHKRP
jgi:hypothetical protein